MDLLAYAQIEDLSDVVKANGIVVKRSLRISPDIAEKLELEPVNLKKKEE